jgi:hypothetical protein
MIFNKSFFIFNLYDSYKLTYTISNMICFSINNILFCMIEKHTKYVIK